MKHIKLTMELEWIGSDLEGRTEMDLVEEIRDDLDKIGFSSVVVDQAIIKVEVMKWKTCLIEKSNIPWECHI